MSANPDDGFAPHASGLFVPKAHQRERETWTKDEYKVLDRAAKLLGERGLSLFIGCTKPECQQAGPIERIRNADGGLTLRCAHKDRVVVHFTAKSLIRH